MAGKRNRATYESDLQAIQSPYVFYGTPLPPLDSNVRDDGSFVPIWKQEVTDERGRKRLHGAFTGGYSAGYFNTVGSKEGWTPATFVSSKTNRWKDSGKQSQNVEDIMDEEDKAEAEESRHISTQSGYTGLGTTEDEINRKAPMMDLFRASNDTMGFNLLRKMGWKDGQGIGPRVLREAVLNDHLLSGKKSTEKHLFAPKNSKLILIARKVDRKGLGYHGEGNLERPSRRSPDHSDEEPSMTKARKQTPNKSAFGVGILNDTGSDDEDPFSLGPKISYSKLVGGDKKKKKKSNVQLGSNSNPLLTKRPVFVSVKANKALAGFRKCHDGRLPLEGFILSISKFVTETTKYPPPKVPDGWHPSRLEGTSDEQRKEWQSSADLAKSSTLQPAARGAILGEAPLPSKSVFDFIKPEGRARLVTLTQNESLPPARSESGPQDLAISDPASQIPILDASIASSALGRGVGGFIPYTDNPAKLARYRTYLSYNAGITTEIPIRPPELTKDEWLREMQEFAHAATIFKPMTGSIAARFTSASAASLLPRDPTASGEESNETINVQKPAKDPAEEAAAMSMFGPLTRSSTFFYPSRLLCKRFNVPVPAHVHSGNEGSSSTPSSKQSHLAQQNPTVSRANPTPPPSTTNPQNPVFTSRFQSSGYQIAPNQEPIPVSGVEETELQGEANTQNHASASTSALVDPDRNEALEKDRPGDDVFKAVFGSDSDDD